MTDTNANNNPATPTDDMFTKEDMEGIIRKRLAQKDEALNRASLQHQDLQSQLSQAQDKLAAQAATAVTPAQPSPATPSEPMQPGMSQQDVENYLQQREHQNQIQAQVQNAAARLSQAAQDDKEFGELAQTRGGGSEQHVLELVNAMGDDALPVIKKALQDPETLQQMIANQDPTSLMKWGYQKSKDLAATRSKPDEPAFNPRPDVYNAGSAPSTDFDDDALASYIKDL